MWKMGLVWMVSSFLHTIAIGSQANMALCFSDFWLTCEITRVFFLSCHSLQPLVLSYCEFMAYIVGTFV